MPGARPAARPSRSQGPAPSRRAHRPHPRRGRSRRRPRLLAHRHRPLGASSAADTVTITVNAPANAAPTANAGPDQSVASAASVSLTGAGSSDPEGGALSYAWSQTGGTPVTLTGAGTVAPSFTAPTLAAGDPAAVLVFSLTVTDPLGASSAADTVTITVNAPANAAPTANAGPDQSVASAASVSLTGAGSSDPEGGALSYAWSQTGGTPVTLTGAGTVAPSFTAPTLAAGDPAAVLVFSLTVTDPLGASSAADTVTITVNAPANAAPTANAGPDQSVASAASVSLTGAGSSDPEGGALSYAWSQTGGTPVTLTGAGTVAPSFTAPTLAAGDPAAVLVFSLTVTDPLGASSAADTVTITVNAPANAAPTANAGPDQSVASAASVSLTGAGSTDPEGGALSYAWSQTGGTPVTLTGAGTVAPSFTAPTLAAGDPAAVLVFSLTVTDPLGASSAADTVTITVNAAGQCRPHRQCRTRPVRRLRRQRLADRCRLVRSRGRRAELCLEPDRRHARHAHRGRHRRAKLHRPHPRRGRSRRRPRLLAHRHRPPRGQLRRRHRHHHRQCPGQCRPHRQCRTRPVRRLRRQRLADRCRFVRSRGRRAELCLEPDRWHTRHAHRGRHRRAKLHRPHPRRGRSRRRPRLLAHRHRPPRGQFRRRHRHHHRHPA